MIRYRKGTSFGAITSGQKSSWAEAVDAFGPDDEIPVVPVLRARSDLRPLGDKEAILSLLREEISYLRGHAGPGGLPRILFQPITGERGSLAIPLDGLDSQSIDMLMEATSEDIDAVTDTISFLSGRTERKASQGESPDEMTAAGWASMLGSVVETALDAGDPGDPDAWVKYDRTMGTIATVCDVVAAASQGVPYVGAILAVIAALCHIAQAIGSALKGYFYDSAEGRNADWGWTQAKWILYDKLRILVQCEDDYLNQDGFVRLLERQGIQGEEDIHDFIDELLIGVRTANRPYEDAQEQALQICLSFGCRAESYRMCRQIQEWLTYLGLGAERAKVIFDWLYDARRFDVVVNRQQAYYTGEATEYAGNRSMFHRTGTDLDDSAEKKCEDASMWAGSVQWYDDCKGLRREWQAEGRERLSLDDLKAIYDWVQQEIGVVGGTYATVTGSRAGAIAQALQEANVGTLIQRNEIEKVHPEVEYMVRPGIDVVEVRWGNVYALAGRGMGVNDVHAVVRMSYTSTRVNGDLWGAIIATNDPQGGAFGGVMPTGYHWVITDEEVASIRSSSFKRRLGAEISSNLPGLGSAAIIGAAGIAAAVAGYLLLKK